MVWRRAYCHAFFVLCRLPLIVSMPQYPLYHFKVLFTASPQPRHTRGLLWARVFHGNAVLPRKTLACQSGRLKNVAQTRLQESIGYATLHLCLSLQVPLTDTLPDSHPIIRTDMPSPPLPYCFIHSQPILYCVRFSIIITELF